MARRKQREKHSRFFGTQQVLRDLNQAAHAVVHDLDSAVVEIPAGGEAGYFLVKNSGADFDVSWGFTIDGGTASSGDIDGGYATAGTPDLTIDGGTSVQDQSGSVDGGSS